MELLAPFAVAALGAYTFSFTPAPSTDEDTAPNQSGTSTATHVDTHSSRTRREHFGDTFPKEVPFGNQLQSTNPGAFGVQGVDADNVPFDPIAAHFKVNSVNAMGDNVQSLRTVHKDPRYELRADSGDQFQYDQKNRGNTHLENQWYYNRLTRDSETPLSMGHLPHYSRSTNVNRREPDTPDMLKPKKRELLEEEVFLAQPEPDRKFYEPILDEQARRARNESKYAAGTGALNGFTMNDMPGALAGPTKGWSTGLEPTRKFTGYHPQQRYFRQDDNLRQRNPHGLRAGIKDTTQMELRGNVDEFRTNGKDQQLATYHRIAVSDGGRAQPHLPDGLRRVELRHVQREGSVAQCDSPTQ